MARPLRIQQAGMWYHVMNRGNAKKIIYHDEVDYANFYAVLGDSCLKFNVEIHAYTLMPNHFHLYLRTNEANLSDFMQRLSTSYSVWHNRRHSQFGHVFQGRYKALAVENDAYGLSVSRYIHLNPVRTDTMVDKPVEVLRKYLHTYTWSSYREMIGLEKPESWLKLKDTLEQFGKTRKAQHTNYGKYVEEGLLSKIDDPFEYVLAQSILGSESFINKISRDLKREGVRDKQAKGAKSTITAVDLSKILEIVTRIYKIPTEEIRKRKRDCEARQVALWLAGKHCMGKMTLVEIGREMGGITNSAVLRSVKHIEERIATDRKLRKRLNKIKLS
jgi:REP element-mobilizing transposase RayT